MLLNRSLRVRDMGYHGRVDLELVGVDANRLSVEQNRVFTPEFGAAFSLDLPQLICGMMIWRVFTEHRPLRVISDDELGKTGDPEVLDPIGGYIEQESTLCRGSH